MEDDPYAGMEPMDEEGEEIDLDTSLVRRAKEEEARDERGSRDGSESGEDMAKDDRPYVASDDGGEDELEVSDGSASGRQGAHGIVPRRRRGAARKSATPPAAKAPPAAKPGPAKKKKKQVDPEEAEQIRLAKIQNKELEAKVAAAVLGPGEGQYYDPLELLGDAANDYKVDENLVSKFRTRGHEPPLIGYAYSAQAHATILNDPVQDLENWITTKPTRYTAVVTKWMQELREAGKRICRRFLFWTLADVLRHPDHGGPEAYRALCEAEQKLYDALPYYVRFVIGRFCFAGALLDHEVRRYAAPDLYVFCCLPKEFQAGFYSRLYRRVCVRFRDMSPFYEPRGLINAGRKAIAKFSKPVKDWMSGVVHRARELANNGVSLTRSAATNKLHLAYLQGRARDFAAHVLYGMAHKERIDELVKTRLSEMKELDPTMEVEKMRVSVLSTVRSEQFWDEKPKVRKEFQEAAKTLRLDTNDPDTL